MPTTSSALSVTTSSLTKAYGPDAGVFDLDIEIEPGSIVGFIGPSGSGKTTTVQLLTGVIAPDSGTVEVLGQRPSSFTKKTRARLGYMPQHAILYPDLTLGENLDFAASLYGVPYRRRKTIARVIEFVELEGAIDRLPRDASGGEQRRVMLASTLIHEPDLLFLDEPTAGIDPVLRRKFWDRFRELASDGKTLLITTQYVGEAADCDFVAVLAGGRVLTIDTPEGLRRSAFDGEVLDIVFERPPDAATVASLQGLDGVGAVEWVDAKTLRAVVDDADRTGRTLSDWSEQRGLELARTERYLAPFDDVFVELISRLDPPKEGSDRH